NNTQYFINKKLTNFLKTETMKTYFIDLKNQGYYIRKEKGEYKGQKFNSYTLIKNDPSPESHIIACWLNKKAVEKLKTEIGFSIVSDDNKNRICHFGSFPTALKFSTQTKEPLMMN